METRRKIAIGAAALFAWVAWLNINNFMDERAAAKARSDEIMRRQALTPEQRIAEDRAKQEAQERLAAEHRQQAAKAAEDRLQQQIATACREVLSRAAHDPSSVSIDDTAVFVSDGKYVAWLTGRAKNGFGALRQGRWQCSFIVSNGRILLESFDDI